ncbi:MAG: fatty acid desaturase [Porticoccaceae bacterium]|nr:fatty acid desaturase [Porticoccaceae bacterium]
MFFDYLRYYTSPFIQILTGIGVYIGGPYVWIGIATLPVLAVLESLLPRDMKERKINNAFLAYIPVWISAVLNTLLYVLLAWRIGMGDYTVIEMIGGTLSVAWLGVVVGVPSLHELYHQRGYLAQLVGTYSQVIYLDCMRNIAHMIGHHLDVGTSKDSDTALRGRDFYTFALAAVVHSTKTAMELESDALEKRGKGRWSIHHRLWKAILAQVVFQGILFAIGGLPALICGLSGVLLARIWVEMFNYFQHYGQVRLVGKPIARRHVWNHLSPLSRVITFEITNHADHHINAYTPFYKLKPDTASVKVPSVFVCFCAALIPPVWYKLIIQPALKEWDLTQASNEERELAREQNLRAGWPDWFAKQQESSAA